MSSLILPRRGFLIGLGALLAAPAIVRVENIMPVKQSPLLLNPLDTIVYGGDTEIGQDEFGRRAVAEAEVQSQRRVLRYRPRLIAPGGLL